MTVIRGIRSGAEEVRDLVSIAECAARQGIVGLALVVIYPNGEGRSLRYMEEDTGAHLVGEVHTLLTDLTLARLSASDEEAGR